MTIQKNIGHCFVFCSFFLFISHGSLTKDIEAGQEDLLLGSGDSFVEKVHSSSEKTQELSHCSRLSKYGVSMLTALLVGSLGGYVSGKIDTFLIAGFRDIRGPEDHVGPIAMVFASWPFFGALRNYTLAAAEKEIRHSLDEEDQDRSCFNLMQGISRLTEWIVWLSV